MMYVLGKLKFDQTGSRIGGYNMRAFLSLLINLCCLCDSNCKITARFEFRQEQCNMWHFVL